MIAGGKPSARTSSARAQPGAQAPSRQTSPIAKSSILRTQRIQPPPQRTFRWQPPHARRDPVARDSAAVMGPKHAHATCGVTSAPRAMRAAPQQQHPTHPPHLTHAPVHTGAVSQRQPRSRPPLSPPRSRPPRGAPAEGRGQEPAGPSSGVRPGPEPGQRPGSGRRLGQAWPGRGRRRWTLPAWHCVPTCRWKRRTAARGRRTTS
jgi:hypothetical protein